VAEAHSFGRYRVTGTLGAGAMGEVFVAVDEVLGREVAVKTLRNRTSGFAARMLDDRFRQEARAIAALAHPNVVQVFALDLDADPPYLVMERAAGPSLKERITGGALSSNEVRALGIQVANALAAAHAVGIVHRDVKPANILAAGPERWKLADFGVAHVPDSSLTITGQFVGSPAYAPPEALVRGDTGPAGDVFGLGATLYEAAAGRWPRRDAPSGAVLAPIPPVRELAPDLPPEIAAAIDRATALDPTQRGTASELAEALAGGGVASTRSLPGVPAIAMTSTAPVRWRRWLLAGVGLVIAIGIIAALTTGPETNPAPVPASPAATKPASPAPRPPAPRPPAPKPRAPDLDPGRPAGHHADRRQGGEGLDQDARAPDAPEHRGGAAQAR